jgi:hypothetical protein
MGTIACQVQNHLLRSPVDFTGTPVAVSFAINLG